MHLGIFKVCSIKAYSLHDNDNECSIRVYITELS